MDQFHPDSEHGLPLRAGEQIESASRRCVSNAA
ncbi:hypothetical protein CEXT_18241, partial [Caerostris extrusa]